MPVQTIQPIINIRESTFHVEESERFCLVMQSGIQRFDVAVLDNISNEFVAFESYHFPKAVTERLFVEQVQRLTEQHDWLNSKFKRVDVSLFTEKFTFVPAALYDSSKQREYLAFNHEVSDDDTLRTDTLRMMDARNVFAIPNKLDSVLRNLAHDIRIRHSLSPLLDHVLTLNKTNTDKQVYAHVHEHQLDVIIAEGNRLLLCNTFRFHTAEDFVYYLLYACEQLKITADQLQLNLLGEIEPDAAAVLLTKKYVRHVKWLSRPEQGVFPASFDVIPAHHFFGLFSLHYFS